MKKILALVLALVMCFAIVSCGDKKDDAATTTAGTTAAADEKDTTAGDTTAADTTAADTNNNGNDAVTGPEGDYTCKAVGAEGQYMDPADLDVVITMTLADDGKGTMTSDGETINIEWALDGDKITITNTDITEDNVITGTYEDGVVCIAEDGSETWFVKDGASLPSNIEIMDMEDLMTGEGLETDASELVGEYELVAYGENLEYYKPEDAGVEMSLKLEEDGKGTLTVMDASTDITWEFDGVFSITLTDADGEVSEGVYMDGIISITEGETEEYVFAAEGVDVSDLIEFSEVPSEE